MITICVTCLNSDRNLIQIQNLLEYTNIWQGVSLQMTDYICWECKAMFNNIWRFKQQVLTAQDVLRNQDLTEIPKVNQCLSKLTKSIKTSYDSEYYEDDVIKTEPPSVDYLDETVLHEEVHLTDDCFRTESMKTEIEDTELNNSNDEVEIEIFSDLRKNITNETEQVNDSKTQIQSKSNSEVIPFKYQLSNMEKLFIIKVMTEEGLLRARESDRELPRYKKSPYKCEKCIIAFVNQDHYTNHINTKHATALGELICKICGTRFSNSNLFRTHTIRHYLCYECKDCDVSSHRIHVMLAHRTKEHGLGKTYHCKICNAGFIKESAMALHFNKFHRERPTCTICKKQFSNKNVLKRHNVLIHGDKPLIKCEICKKQVKNIKVHMATHGPADVNAYCAECNIQFKTIASYKKHLYSTSKHVEPDKLPYACDECGKRFPTKQDVTCHINIVHYDKKEFVCPICKKGFGRKNSLKRHILYIHEGARKPRKYICSYCNRGFTTRPVLDNHIRTHTGERPFECELCDAKFAQQVVLRTHMKGVHKKLFKKSGH